MPTMSADTLTAFDAWLEERDLLATAKVSAARVDGFGVCLTANKALQSGEAVLAVPRRLHLTAKLAEGTDLGEALAKLEVLEEEEAARLEAEELVRVQQEGEATLTLTPNLP